MSALTEWAAFYGIQSAGPGKQQQAKQQSWRDIKAIFLAQAKKRRKHGDSGNAERPAGTR